MDPRDASARLRRVQQSLDAVSTRPDNAPTDLPAGYPVQFEKEVAAPGGLHYRIRPILPSDAARLADFHRHLGQHSVYLRFFSAHRELSPAELERFTQVDYVNRFALVAEVEDRLVAIGRFDRLAVAFEAEVAFVVADEYQRHGIGSRLLQEIVIGARSRGISVLRATTLSENQAMRDVFRHSGYPVATSYDAGTIDVRF